MIITCAIRTPILTLSDHNDQANIQRYEKLIEITKHVVINSSSTEEYKKTTADQIMLWYEAIKEIDPSYETPQSFTFTPSGGCYVATAVYGSYDCPQVWTLRRYRDYTLAETWYGRTFIRAYYTISPTLVKWFGHTEWFKNMWKGKLDRMVANLNADGVENTPYEDRNW